MRVLSSTSDSTTIELTATELLALANLLLQTEHWPFEAVGPREFVRQLQREFLAAAENQRER